MLRDRSGRGEGMKTYNVYYYNKKGELIEQTNIDAFSFKLALELAEEFKIKSKVWKIEITEGKNE